MTVSKRGEIERALEHRKSFQQLIKKKLGKEGREKLKEEGAAPLLGLTPIDKNNIWILDRILIDAPEFYNGQLGIDDLVSAIIDLTPENYRWLKELHGSTMQSAGYIINRLVESVRLSIDWEIPPATPSDVTKAMRIIKDYERRQNARYYIGSTKHKRRTRKERPPESRY